MAKAILKISLSYLIDINPHQESIFFSLEEIIWEHLTESVSKIYPTSFTFIFHMISFLGNWKLIRRKIKSHIILFKNIKQFINLSGFLWTFYSINNSFQKSNWEVTKAEKCHITDTYFCTELFTFSIWDKIELLNIVVNV